MARITGNTTTTPMTIPDFKQDNEKKADYIKNRPLYLTNFFKEVPKGKTIDDLQGADCTGCYVLYDPEHMGCTGLLYVAFGIYSDNEAQMDIPCTYQTRYILDADGMGTGNSVKIETRNDAYGWSKWEDVFETKEGTSYLKSCFKEVPSGVSIDALYGEEHLGCYIGKVKSQWNGEANINEDFNFLFVNDGWTVTDMGDASDYFQTRFVWDGFNYKIQTRKGSGGDWSNWEDVFSGGSEAKHFPYEPQLDITLEEAVQKLEVNEVNGVSWADSDFTAIKVIVENAVLETAGPNTQVCVYINSRGYTSTQTTLGSPTTFINGTKKQYWSCYADLKSGLMITCDSSTTNETWASGISMPINMQRLNLKKKLEFISIEYMNTNSAFPVGTRFRIWLR